MPPNKQSTTYKKRGADPTCDMAIPQQISQWRGPERSGPYLANKALLQRLLRVAGLSYGLWLLAATASHTVGHPVPALTVAMVGFAMAPTLSILFLFRASAERRRRPRVHYQLESNSGTDQFYVRMLVFNKEVLLGDDEGIVTFADGWMSFAGHYCDFSIYAGDVKSVDSATSDLKDLFRSCPGQISLRSQAGGAQLGMYPHVDMQGNLPDNYDFVKRLGRWSVEPRNPNGHAIYPPVEVHPTGTFFVWKLFWCGIVTLASLFLAGASFSSITLLDVGMQSSWVFLSPLMPFGAMAFGSYSTLRKQLMGQRKVQAEKRSAVDTESMPSIAVSGSDKEIPHNESHHQHETTHL